MATSLLANDSSARSMRPSTSLPCCFLDVNLEPAGYIYMVNITVSVINIISSLTAVLGNFLILLAVWRSPSLRSTSITLLLSLALSDFCIGFVVQPSFVVFKVAQNGGVFGLQCIFGLISETGGWLVGSVSFSIILLISFDRYLALRLHLRYQTIVTTQRIFVALICTCLFYAAVASLRFATNNSHLFHVIVTILLGLGLLIITPIYAKIFQTTRRHQRRVFAEVRSLKNVRGHSMINMAKLRKSAIGIAYIAVIFQICYLPLFCVLLAKIVQDQSEQIDVVYTCAITLVLFSSSINPALYCWRMKDIRRAVMRIFKNFCPKLRIIITADDKSWTTGGMASRIN